MKVNEALERLLAELLSTDAWSARLTVRGLAAGETPVFELRFERRTPNEEDLLVRTLRSTT